MIVAAGGEVLVASPTVDVREGTYEQLDSDRPFPTLEAADGWYASSEHQALLPLDTPRPTFGNSLCSSLGLFF